MKELCEPARKAYSSTFGEDAPTLTVDAKDFLPPPPKTGDENEGVTWCEGVGAHLAGGGVWVAMGGGGLWLGMCYGL